MKFEDILEQVGAESRYQKFLIIFLLLPTSFFNVFFEGMFLLSTPDHWCHVSELKQFTNEQQHQLIRPLDAVTGKRSNCERFDIDYGKIINNRTYDFDELKTLLNQTLVSSNKISCDNKWVYDQSLYTETAVTWFDFVCERTYYVNLIMSLSASGLAVMTPLISHLSDSHGRKKAMILTLIIAEISCLSPIIFKDIYSFIITRFLSGGILCVYYHLPFVLTQELVSQKYRTLASSLSAIFYSLGSCTLTLALKLTGNWVTFTWVQFTFTLFFIIAYKIIPESPSWLISKKRYEEAHKQLTKICHFNKRKVPDDLMAKIKLIESDEDRLARMNEEISDNPNRKKKNGDSFLDLILMPGLRSKTFIITILFMACNIGYSGIVSNTVNMEANNQLYNYFLLSFIDLPSLFICWKLINTPLGRRWTNVITMGVCGISLLIPGLFKRQYDEVFYTICTLIAKFGVAGTFMIIFQHSTELYPTTLRNQGIGLTATIASIGGISVPQIIYISKYGEWIPFFIIGIICVISSIFASFLPETLNHYLPQRAIDAAKFGHDQKFFSLANTRKITNQNNVNDNDERTQQNGEMREMSIINPLINNNDHNNHTIHNNNSNNDAININS